MPITANPTAVGVWSTADKGKTTITWSAGVRAKVFRFVNGANRTQFDGGATGALTGTKQDADLSLGNTYRYDLQRTNDNVVVATVTVTTYDVQQNLVGAAIPNIDLALFTQEVINLTIAPGIDFVRISFQTTQPTIPLVSCSAPDGSHSEWFPLFGGLRTKHMCILGESTPLPQNVTHSYRIVAAGHTFFGKPMEKIVTGTFQTGSRHATVIFDRIKVRNDSDKLSAGEIGFAFGAGDADSGVRRSEPWPSTTLAL